MYEATADRFQVVDVLYNNAGISPADDASVLDTTVDAGQRVQDVTAHNDLVRPFTFDIDQGVHQP